MKNANVDQSGGSETPCITDDGSEMNDQRCESIHSRSDGDETLTCTPGRGRSPRNHLDTKGREKLGPSKDPPNQPVTVSRVGGWDKSAESKEKMTLAFKFIVDPTPTNRPTMKHRMQMSIRVAAVKSCITDDGSEMNDQRCESIHLRSDGDETLTCTQSFKDSSAHTHCFTSAATPGSEI